NVPFILLMGLDETRPLEERALAFLEKHGKKNLVLDAKTFDLTGIDEEVRGYIAPLAINFVLRMYALALSKERNHPLETRRYMFKIPY
ncbi:SIS domain-containing protein, partial [Paenibacillus sp. p-8]